MLIKVQLTAKCPFSCRKGISISILNYLYVMLCLGDSIFQGIEVQATTAAMCQYLFFQLP